MKCCPTRMQLHYIIGIRRYGLHLRCALFDFSLIFLGDERAKFRVFVSLPARADAVESDSFALCSQFSLAVCFGKIAGKHIHV